MRDVLVLGYHAVSESWGASLAVAPATLREQLAWLLSRDYQLVTFHEAVHAPPAAKVVAVTFDDGYRSVVDQAFPILAELGAVASVFVPTAHVGRPEPMCWPGISQWAAGDDADELLCMNWDDAARLTRAGWEIGSHTCSHPRLTTLTDEALHRELVESRGTCEDRLGVACRSLAFPYGDHDERVIAAAGRAGYDTAGTLPSRLHRPQPMRWPRVGVNRGDTMRRFRAKASPMLRRVRASWAWEPLVRVTGVRQP
jgi:peptidoglycan/xylan/chitin deacetylase (PgdA/CDA1 family)